MIKTPTVLILGAGPSVHVGYPLGAQLVSEICRLPTSKNVDDIQFIQEAPGNIEDFFKRLGRSAYYSIDAFLEQNQDCMETGRFLITWQLKKQEDVDRLFPPHNSGWYQYLFNQIDSEGVDRIQENALSIITFNYDRSLECYLHEVIQNRYRLSTDDAAERLSSVRIIHPHGILGAYPQTPYTQKASSDEILQISKGIKIIHELRDGSSPEFKAAKECLMRAERILFLGFGFHPDNVSRFDFFTPEAVKGKEIMAAIDGIGTAKQREMLARLNVFGFGQAVIWGTACNNFFNEATSLY